MTGAKEPGMSVRVGINGFGRIGRNVLRAIAEAGRTDIEVVGINDLAPVETNAHLLRFDSVHGRFPGEVTVKGDAISVGNGLIKVTAIKEPTTLPWKDLGVDVALECTGIFTSKDKAAAHLAAGAKRVIISAPADGVDLTVVYGVNHDKLTPHHKVVSNASCTTNCLAPVAKVLNDAVGIDKGFMTTVKRAAEQQLKGILGYTEAPNVSSDFNHDAHSSVFAMDQTKVMDGTLVRVMAWYDNEWGFSNRMVDTAVAMGKLI
jgi:glyceraldehyde-3-phosphate dehydrogenase type I